MVGLAAIVCGALAGLGLVAMVIGLKKAPVKVDRQRLRDFQAKNLRERTANLDTQVLISLGLAAALAFGAWAATGWPVAALIGAGAGVITPKMVVTPRRRQAVADEIEAYSQWTEQIRDLVSASGSLFEAVTLSAPSAPPMLRSQVTQLGQLAGTVGLKPALDWFAAEMKSPYADRLVLGLNIAWDSGARVTEAFESVSRAMRTEVEMRRRNEVANARTWTQVISIVGITVVSVLLMFVFNRGFFDPFGSLVGQVVLLMVGVMIFGNILWVLKMSASGVPVRLLDQQVLEAEVAKLITTSHRTRQS
ncbi:type II secretion system F family protein [Candidatus Poriferisodalis sp.]|uniref:type II secretion system F family protein n=1 Tax=Candidatus Poriferisodalis sp. TaxID=3101277 RepID=UPI003B517DDC